MQALRNGNSTALVRLGTSWFRMDLRMAGKIARCARALEESRSAFDAALEVAFDPRERRAARTFLLRHRAPRAAAAAGMDGALSEFLAVCRSMRFIDYSKPARARSQDGERMARYASEEPPPPLSHPIGGSASVRLPAVLQAIGESTFLNRAEVEFVNHRVGKRGVPSHGARHPFDAIFAWQAGKRSVEAYFDPVSGRARRLARPGRPRQDLGASYWIRLYTSYERVQWRYRHSGFYDTLLLDAGHILSNVTMVAAALGWRVRGASSPEAQPAESEPLVNEVFLEVELVRHRGEAAARGG